MLWSHHIIHWADGGETKLDNLVLICTRHHRLVHEFGYRISKTETGFEFVKPGVRSTKADLGSKRLNITGHKFPG